MIKIRNFRDDKFENRADRWREVKKKSCWEEEREDSAADDGHVDSRDTQRVSGWATGALAGGRRPPSALLRIHSLTHTHTYNTHKQHDGRARQRPPSRCHSLASHRSHKTGTAAVALSFSASQPACYCICSLSSSAEALSSAHREKLSTRVTIFRLNRRRDRPRLSFASFPTIIIFLTRGGPTYTQHIRALVVSVRPLSIYPNQNLPSFSSEK